MRNFLIKKLKTSLVAQARDSSKNRFNDVIFEAGKKHQAGSIRNKMPMLDK